MNSCSVLFSIFSGLPEPVIVTLRLSPGPFLPIGHGGVGWFVDNWFDSVISSCVAIQFYDLSHVCTIAHMTDNTIDSVLMVEIFVL